MFPLDTLIGNTFNANNPIPGCCYTYIFIFSFCALTISYTVLHSLYIAFGGPIDNLLLEFG